MEFSDITGVGFAIAFVVARVGPAMALSKLVPPGVAAFIRLPSLNPDLRVFLFALTAAVLSSIFFGLAPALQATRSSFDRHRQGHLRNRPAARPDAECARGAASDRLCSIPGECWSAPSRQPATGATGHSDGFDQG